MIVEPSPSSVIVSLRYTSVLLRCSPSPEMTPYEPILSGKFEVPVEHHNRCSSPSQHLQPFLHRCTGYGNLRGTLAAIPFSIQFNRKDYLNGLVSMSVNTRDDQVRPTSSSSISRHEGVKHPMS